MEFKIMLEGYTHEGEFVLVAEDGANDLKNYPVKCVNGRIWENNHAHVLQGKPDVTDNQFLAYSINQTDIHHAHVLQGKPDVTDNQFLAYSINQTDIESLLVGGSRQNLMPKL
ncbi:hypothetical protein [Akkermansia muciniphila]|uniref:hypothetical protein n=1 Tax=Akkermansia muciniphila TaxID=239935 RepID=UPI0016511DCE|nr:hypothetical protein [Akkermansia muciniphila]